MKIAACGYISSRKSIVSLIAKVAFCVALLALALSAQSSRNESEADKLVRVKKIAETTAGWDAASTLGAKAELLEVEKKAANGVLIVAYNLRVTGLPKDRLYKLISWPISAQLPQIALKGVSISGEDYAICEGHKKDQCKLDPVDPRIRLIFPKVAKGEIVRVGLMTPDNTLMALSSVVPDPISSTDKDCDLEAVRVLPGFVMALIRAKGFHPNEEVSWASTSAGESLTFTGTTNANGEIVQMILPAVKGHDHGTDEITLKGSRCSPKIAFDWSIEP